MNQKIYDSILESEVLEISHTSPTIIMHILDNFR